MAAGIAFEDICLKRMRSRLFATGHFVGVSWWLCSHVEQSSLRAQAEVALYNLGVALLSCDKDFR